MVTIKDVAERAGVNASTVSRALKDSSTISQKTKDKVKKAMQELGYVPNVAAKMLASGLTHAVGVIFPPLSNEERVTHPFFMEILTVINDEAKKRDFTVSIATGGSVEELKEQVQLMYRQRLVDGFIVLYSESHDPVRHYLMENNIPFVIVGQPEEFENEVTFVDNDNQLMSKTAVDYLNQRGHENILFVTDDLQSEIFSERYIGYLKGVNKLGLKSSEAILFDRTDAESLQLFIETIQENSITALIVIDDMLALRVMQFLSFYGIKVPDDASIVSFNNSVYAKIMHPYLTTFDINVKSLGRSSLMRLLDMVEKRMLHTERVIIPFLLKERETVRNLLK
ncbi:LacI family DNA-binding transcriptional regulator [Streptococcus hillyeri]|uniref:LacI family transcriptional regulator n=1 Tax=Streptococcus hillyeri TaxID=2282420 RepID=A0A3L9DQC8_9STRE|nr:LacI family DNA-binding transcriptional regulator [Streptococcus hillyeri]RLY01869.1 LacI family transcriptional regulator [Streptococcus hillyeri]